MLSWTSNLSWQAFLDPCPQLPAELGYSSFSVQGPYLRPPLRIFSGVHQWLPSKSTFDHLGLEIFTWSSFLEGCLIFKPCLFACRSLWIWAQFDLPFLVCTHYLKHCYRRDTFEINQWISKMWSLTLLPCIMDSNGRDGSNLNDGSRSPTVSGEPPLRFPF